LYNPLKLLNESVSSAVLNIDEDTLITGHYEGSVKIWDIGMNFGLREQLVGFDGSKCKVKKVMVTHDNSLYALGSDGNSSFLSLGCIKLMKLFI